MWKRTKELLMISAPSIIILTIFFGFFLLMIIPKYRFVTDGFPDYLEFKNNFHKFTFVVHILAGIVVYISGIVQFIPAIRNQYPTIHWQAGRVYIVASMICVFGLYFIITLIPVWGLSIAQFINGTLWIIFVMLAYYHIRKRNIIAHRRFMISSFICASYFVTIRLVDKVFMPLFRWLTNTEEEALTLSDLSVFVIPLIIVWMYWGIKKQPVIDQT